MAMGVRALLESIEFIPGNPTALLKVVLAAELVLKALDNLVKIEPLSASKVGQSVRQ